jgi:hypothetical protein
VVLSVVLSEDVDDSVLVDSVEVVLSEVTVPDGVDVVLSVELLSVELLSVELLSVEVVLSDVVVGLVEVSVVEVAEEDGVGETRHEQADETALGFPAQFSR